MTNKGKTPVQLAMDTMRAAMRDDPHYAHSWHCNIASCARDEGVPWAKAQDIASRFMKLAFDAVTKANVGIGPEHFRTDE